MRLIYLITIFVLLTDANIVYSKFFCKTIAIACGSLIYIVMKSNNEIAKEEDQQQEFLRIENKYKPGGSEYKKPQYERKSPGHKMVS